MQVSGNLEETLNIDPYGFIYCTGKNYRKLFKKTQVNALGAMSAKSQSLGQIITSISRFLNSQQRLYLKIKDNKALGFVRVGEKALFYRDYSGNFRQLYPTCVLDIYVHQSCQRTGIGNVKMFVSQEIFEKFLQIEKKEARKLAYDRPSSKLIGFLKKHYNLVKYIPQSNNYVIFNQFFDDNNTFNKKILQPQKQIITQNQLQLLDKTLMNFGQKKLSQKTPLDSLQILKMQVQNLRTNKNTVVQQKIKEIGYRTPWAVKQEKGLLFRTTANTYGNYYLHKN